MNQPTIEDLAQILLSLKKQYPSAMKEAWLNGFEAGAKAGKEGAEYGENHYNNSETKKSIKLALHS